MKTILSKCVNLKTLLLCGSYISLETSHQILLSLPKNRQLDFIKLKTHGGSNAIIVTFSSILEQLTPYAKVIRVHTTAKNDLEFNFPSSTPSTVSIASG